MWKRRFLGMNAQAVAKVDEVMDQLRGRSIVDRMWLVDQLLDLTSLEPVGPVPDKARAVMGEIAELQLVERTWAVDQLLDIRVLATSAAGAAAGDRPPV
jgi:hypothetical protein